MYHPEVAELLCQTLADQVRSNQDDLNQSTVNEVIMPEPKSTVTCFRFFLILSHYHVFQLSNQNHVEGFTQVQRVRQQWKIKAHTC